MDLHDGGAGSEIAAAVRMAERMYAVLGRRDEVLGNSICSDPAWNILLDLLIAHGSGRPLSVTDVCIGARVPSATAHRYLTLLIEAGLARRGADAFDGRRHYVALTPQGVRRMLDLLLHDR